MEKCGVCQRDFICKINYKNVICSLCIKEYRTRTYKGDIVQYYFDKNIYGKVTIGDSVTLTTCKECVINDTPCYAVEVNNDIYFISTDFKPLNKLIEKVKNLK